MFDEANDTTDDTRPEIYAMGFRNPFRLTVDPKTGWILMGDYGPDAGDDNPNRGPQGSVEYNVVTSPGNYGWPYCIRENTAYNDYNFATGASGAAVQLRGAGQQLAEQHRPDEPAAGAARHDVDRLRTARVTRPAVPGASAAGGAPTGGPRYDFDPDLDSDTKFPEFYDGHWFIGEWNNGWIKTATLDARRQRDRRLRHAVDGHVRPAARDGVRP